MKGASYLISILSLVCSAGCVSDSAKRTVTSQSVRLKQTVPSDYLYYRVDHYAIIVSTEDLTNRLASTVNQSGNPRDRVLLDEVRRAGSSAIHTDLFAVAFLDPSYLQRIELLLADALEAGQCTIIDVFALQDEVGRILPFVKLTFTEEGAYRARRFDTPSADLILQVTDNVG
jgi:hypothetical protein